MAPHVRVGGMRGAAGHPTERHDVAIVAAFVIGVGTLAGCGARAGGAAPASAPPAADLVLQNGAVFTMDPARPRARAIAIAKGRIAFVGDDASPWIGASTRVIDLGGRAVVPSLTDAHAHLSWLGESLEHVALEGCTGPDDCVERLRKVPANEREQWIHGHGWDQNRFADKQFPTHAAIDRVVADRPVWLRRVGGHAGWANARALALAGIDRSTKDPTGGRIVRDAAGNPTGVLVDNAMALVEKVVPPASDEALERRILRAQDIALEHGLTEVHEMGIDEPTVQAYRRLAGASRLRIRVYAFKTFGALDATFATKPDAPARDALFTVRGVKLFADGALGSRGAALLAPYSDEPSTSGLLLTSPETIEKAARAALASGWQLAIHAIGDRANRIVLDAFEHAGCADHPEHRFRLEHAQVLATEDIGRLGKLGVIASMQPKHATSDMAWAPSRLGADRLAGAYAWRRVLASGARVAWGSDFPVEDVSVVAGLHAAVTRTDAGGHPAGGWLPDQRLTLDEALHGFTAGAAYAAFEESWRGRAAVDQAADLTVFDRELTETSLLQARPVMTIVGGNVVYEKK